MSKTNNRFALCRHRCYIPLISFSFLNQRRSAAGLLPWVMQVRVMWSPSMAGFVRPSISGFSGTPEEWDTNHPDGTNSHTAVCHYETITLLCLIGNSPPARSPCREIREQTAELHPWAGRILADTLVDGVSNHWAISFFKGHFTQITKKHISPKLKIK